jgi:hypothetical protein
MGSLLNLILPALVPAFSDGVRGLFAKLTGGAGGQPQNMQERISLIQAETERLKALSALDTPTGEPSKWIVDLRACYRYVIISFILIATICVVIFYKYSIIRSIHIPRYDRCLYVIYLLAKECI